MEFSKIEVRSTIRFFALQGESAAEIYRKLLKVYGDHTPSVSSVERWVREFKCGRTSIEDLPRAPPENFATNDFMSEKVSQILELDRRVTIDQIALELGISHGSVSTILHKKLGLSKLSARWVPRLLTRQQKEKRVQSCLDLLKLWDEDPTHFHTKIVTEDESWFYHYDPETKQQSKEWMKTGESGPIKAKRVKSAGKVLGTIFWDSVGVLKTDFIPKGTTMNAVHYVEVLDGLRYNIRNRRRGALASGLCLLHDNASSHSAKIVKAALSCTGLWEIDFPPYSPDLAPSDFYLFPKMKKLMKGRRYETDNEVIASVQDILNSFSSEFYSEAFRQLRYRLERCIELQGDYIEKPQSN